ncbi:MAG: bifunctional 5,10-methylenetetrahydrofolate dehydrogenase/5,10-methenyltetrahydrofolate cyclohydrolase [Patescibacteria group bacterium]
MSTTPKAAATIIDCRPIRAERKEALVTYIASCAELGRAVPTLAIVQVGDRPDSTAFIKAKQKFADEIGAQAVFKHLPETASQRELVELVSAISADKSIHGVIVQLPLPLHLNKDEIIDAIHPSKDVDGLTSHNTKALWEGKENCITPATARGVLEIFDYQNISLEGKHVVMMGRSSLVGKPVALSCLHRGAAVTIVHTKTENPQAITKSADVLIVAIGKPHFVTKDYVSEGQIVIDIGITPIDQGGKIKTAGDVDSEGIKNIVSAYTPVPYGVGQMTVLALFENLIDAHQRQYGKM